MDDKMIPPNPFLQYIYKHFCFYRFRNKCSQRQNRSKRGGGGIILSTIPAKNTGQAFCLLIFLSENEKQCFKYAFAEQSTQALEIT